ncbi:A/G-specific adenine glycosylase [Flavobacterium agricola]|uniref:Adenine DNA glycosylase n=1 Tax=Flavobacterium agricola TaxID=2870839 RepID=A0ABY6LWY6_9FLAO|nr:A/G-specific adenine glycosylase [Flavobacterium agricola]UYW00844.1 A/G-specific adenine glycosylase [Flavobacterium agricola]
MIFYNTLITWYLANKRDLPWRKTTNPYHIWLSEIILQQTRVAQGLPYYEAFIERFYKVSDLANASQEDVLKLWQGLGYYSRARNLHATAQYVSFELNNQFPDNYNDLLKLKGVGSYTAAAIASFAYNEKIAVVDGNVFRVLSRIFGIDADISLLKTKKIFQELANKLLLEGNPCEPALFNQAIMDFGALQCVPKSPNCTACCFASSCLAYATNKVAELPYKSAKIKIKKRYFDYVLIKGNNQKYKIVKRDESDIWAGLHQFELLESTDNLAFNDANQTILNHFATHNVVSLLGFDSDYLVHKLSHQHLHIRFWLLEVNQEVNGVKKHEIADFSFPIVLANFLDKNYHKI